MKRGHPHSFCDRAHQVCYSILHFLGSFIGEGNREDPKWADVVFFDEVGDTVGEDPSFTRPGACHNQHWSATMDHRVMLSGVKSFEDVVGAHGRVQVV